MFIRLIKQPKDIKNRVFIYKNETVADFNNRQELTKLADESGFELQIDDLICNVVLDGEILIGFEDQNKTAQSAKRVKMESTKRNDLKNILKNEDELKKTEEHFENKVLSGVQNAASLKSKNYDLENISENTNHQTGTSKNNEIVVKEQTTQTEKSNTVTIVKNESKEFDSNKYFQKSIKELNKEVMAEKDPEIRSKMKKILRAKIMEETHLRAAKKENTKISNEQDLKNDESKVNKRTVTTNSPDQPVIKEMKLKNFKESIDHETTNQIAPKEIKQSKLKNQSTNARFDIKKSEKASDPEKESQQSINSPIVEQNSTKKVPQPKRLPKNEKTQKKNSQKSKTSAESDDQKNNLEKINNVEPLPFDDKTETEGKIDHRILKQTEYKKDDGIKDNFKSQNELDVYPQPAKTTENQKSTNNTLSEQTSVQNQTNVVTPLKPGQKQLFSVSDTQHMTLDDFL